MDICIVRPEDEFPLTEETVILRKKLEKVSRQLLSLDQEVKTHWDELAATQGSTTEQLVADQLQPKPKKKLGRPRTKPVDPTEDFEDTPLKGNFDKILGAFEKSLLVEALTIYNWNVSKAAAYLGISRRVLTYKANNLGLVRIKESDNDEESTASINPNTSEI